MVEANRFETRLCNYTPLAYSCALARVWAVQVASVWPSNTAKFGERFRGHFKLVEKV